MSEKFEYTDDIIAGAVVVGYMVQSVANLQVPEWSLAAALCWTFGKKGIEGMKRFMDKR